MHYYSKILAPFKRDSAKAKYVDEKLWSKPEFAFLKDVTWSWTAKADGTSVYVKWDGERVSYYGHTDKTQFNERTKKWLNDTFLTKEAESIFEQLYGSKPVNLYGEFVSDDYNQNYGHHEGYFYAFDIQNGANGNWWNREALEAFVDTYNDKSRIDIVPVMVIGTIDSAVAFVKAAKEFYTGKRNLPMESLKGRILEDKLKECCKCPFDPSAPLEGLVGKPMYELSFGNGDRVITKVKCEDFEIKEEIK